MKTTAIALYLTMISAVCAGVDKDHSPSVVAGFKLRLDQEAYFTDLHGKADPNIIVHTPIGKSVRIYRTDGFCYTGTVTEIDESGSHFKIYGVINNVAQTKFGFVLAKGGVFAGAVIEYENECTYVLEFSAAHQGYVLCRSTKHNKPRA